MLQAAGQTFREWDKADPDEKKRLLVNLITNAAGKRLVSDDIVRLFLGWIDSYHESHFAVIREIYKRGDTPPTRYDIWVAVYGEPAPRDDSGEGKRCPPPRHWQNLAELVGVSARKTYEAYLS
jgi:hypothetical protein